MAYDYDRLLDLTRRGISDKARQMAETENLKDRFYLMAQADGMLITFRSAALEMGIDHLTISKHDNELKMVVEKVYFSRTPAG